ARHLAQLVGIDAADEPGDQSAWALRRLLELLAGSGPVIAVVDDLHWGEQKLLDLLLQVAAEVSGPVLVAYMARFDLLERRPDWERACPTTIALKPLHASEIEELVEQLIGDALPTAFRARLVELAAGNPLFVEQVLHMLVDEGRLRIDGDGWEASDDAAEIEVPPSIEAILAARIDHLSGPERACAECAGVVGMEFSASALEEIVGESASRSLASLARKLVIEPVRRPGAGEGMLRFRHLLLREAVYEAIPKSRRADLHERVGEWLLGWADERLGEIEEIVGYHFEAAARYSSELLTEGGDPDRLAGRAVQHLTAAGRRSAARQDDHEAAGFFRRAVSLLGEGNPTRLEPLLELGSALVRGGDTGSAAAAVADARRVATSADDPRLDAEVRTLEANLRRLANPRWWAAHGRAEASELARIYRELGDPAGSAKAWHLLGKAHSDRGEQAASQEAFEHALEFAQEAGDAGIEAWIRYWLIQSAVFGPTRCEEVVARGREDLAWARAHRNRSLEGSIQARIGEMLARSGRAAAAAEAFAEARRIFDEIGRPSHIAYLALSVAAVEPLASDPAAAERELRPSFEFFEEVGAEHILASVAPMLAAALVPQGRTDEALELTELAERIAAPDDLDGQVKWRLARASALALGGDHAVAERHAREACALASPTDSVLLEADAHAGLGSVLIAGGAAGEASAPIERAADLYEAKGDSVSTARWRATLADLARTG
ncbi:MAG: ATP-binding protein, partial [Solirubrobacterales bacterium]